ncbi:IclR family transcriptional regulator [Streptomyces canus]|uniref:IclR family transcriptional regulator n=1 Tax=Streptomyces canus TaxID=58343 RepID=UPI0033A160C6
MGTSHIKSAERVLDVLDLLARRSDPVTAREVSAALNLPKSTTHHLLNVMRDRHFLAYRADHRAWTLGTAAFEMGAAYLRNGPLGFEGQRFLAELTRRTNETSHLAVLRGTDVVYLGKQEPPVPGIRLVTEIGTRLPAHLTAVGRAMLAQTPLGLLTALYTGYDWPDLTGVGPHSLAALRSLLDTDRERGSACEEGSITPGIACVASAVHARDGAPIAAVGVAFVAAAQTVTSTEGLTAEVRRVAADFSLALSEGPPVGQ